MQSIKPVAKRSRRKGKFLDRRLCPPAAPVNRCVPQKCGHENVQMGAGRSLKATGSEIATPKFCNVHDGRIDGRADLSYIVSEICPNPSASLNSSSSPPS